MSSAGPVHTTNVHAVSDMITTRSLVTRAGTKQNNLYCAIRDDLTVKPLNRQMLSTYREVIQTTLVGSVAAIAGFQWWHRRAHCENLPTSSLFVSQPLAQEAMKCPSFVRLALAVHPMRRRFFQPSHGDAKLEALTTRCCCKRRSIALFAASSTNESACRSSKLTSRMLSGGQRSCSFEIAR